MTVSTWLDWNAAAPFDDYTDLIENRDDERRSDALLWFGNDGVERDESAVLNNLDAHANVALAVFGTLAGDDLGNGWKLARFRTAAAGSPEPVRWGGFRWSSSRS